MKSTSFFCAMYPTLNELDDYALAYAHQYLLNRVRLNKNHPCFKGGFSKGDHVEAMAMVTLEQDYRWNNGGRVAFEEKYVK